MQAGCRNIALRNAGAECSNPHTKLQVFFDVLNYKTLCANCLSVSARLCVRSEWGTLERITDAEIDAECFKSGRDIVVSGDRARQIRLAFLVIFVSLVRRVNTHTYI